MKKPYYTYPVRLLSLILCGVVLLLALWHMTGSGILGRRPLLDQERGVALVGRLAAEAHRRGSAEQQRVREELLGLLREAGAEPVEMVYEVTAQDARRIGGSDVVTPASELTNLLVVVPGARRDAVLLVSHYDSVPMGPGASDGMTGVVNLLLALEKIEQEGLAFENTLLFLFTDGGEEGRMGAELFAENRAPKAVRREGEALSAADTLQYRERLLDVKLVLNLAAYGTGGPVVLAETGKENARLVSEFAGVNPGLPATSLWGTIFRMRGEETDYSPFAARNIQGLNFVSVGRGWQHHTANDDPAHLAAYTLSRGGDAVFAALRHYGNTNLEALGQSRSDNYYFDYLGLATFAVPGVVWWALAAAAVVLFFIWAARAGARNSAAATLRNVILGLLVFALGLAAAGGAVWGIAQLLSAVSAGWAARLASPLYMSLPLWGGMSLIGVFAALLVWGGLGKPLAIGGRQLRESATLALCLLGVVCAFVLPAAAYVFLPAGLVGLLLMIFTTLRAAKEPPAMGLYALVFAVLAPFALSLSYLGLCALGATALPYLVLPVVGLLAFPLAYALDIPARRRILAWVTACSVVLVLGAAALGMEAVWPGASEPGDQLGTQGEGYQPAFDADRLQYELTVGERDARPVIRDADLVRNLRRPLSSLGFRRAEDGWEAGQSEQLARVQQPVLAVRRTQSAQKIAITVQRAYPDSIYTLRVPTLGVTQISYESAGGDSGSVTFDPISAGAPPYRIFQAREDATVTITSQGGAEMVRYTEYVQDAALLEDLPLTQALRESAPGVRTQLNIVQELRGEEEALPMELEVPGKG